MNLNKAPQVPSELLGGWNESTKVLLQQEPKLRTNKFLNHDKFIKEHWIRTHRYLAELCSHSNPKKILDMSCGSGAQMEILKYYGHDVLGCDYTSKIPRNREPLRYQEDLTEKKSCIYEPLLKSQKLPYILHDGNQLPYPFEDNQFDVVLCWGAIQNYSHPDYWHLILEELTRIAKHTILVGFNIPISKLPEDREYVAKYKKAMENAKQVNKNGFHLLYNNISVYKFITQK